MGNTLANAGVVVLDQPTPWAPFADLMLEIVAKKHSRPERHQDIQPLSNSDWLELRQDLFDAVPGLRAYFQSISTTLKSACAVFVPEVGIAQFTASERATIAYAACVCLGNPTATDSKQVVWDVRARQRESTWFSTFSETDGEARWHTDTQYFPTPEAQFALYCVEPARCLGGLSSVLDARALRAHLQANRPKLFQALSRKVLPFRVPSAFVSSSNPNVVEATLAPILSKELPIRYRRDTLLAGLRYFPEYKDHEAEALIEMLEEELAEFENQAEFFMQRDSMVLMDNWNALHARTSFTDHERHLVRIRMRPADQVEISSAKMIQREVEAAQLLPA